MPKPELNLVTAAILVIGDEILSGRTRDENISEIAQVCTQGGVDLREVRIIGDVESEIIDAVNVLRARYTYVFTTGGIGPTHDDITADAVAKAFGVELSLSKEVCQLLENRYGKEALTAANKRMARIPAGAALIVNAVSGAPGFQLENVYVMAGVPVIMRSMLESIAPTLKGGNVVHSRSILVGVGESRIAKGLGEVQKQFASIKIGSYPRMGKKPVYTEVVLRGTDLDLLDEATQKVQKIVDVEHAAQNIEIKGNKS
ncbi:MAG: molybdopterin-binding protein [Devosiaceae bacterium]|nr:molybdopterin-binding protein [Devosiaceae bacterium]